MSRRAVSLAMLALLAGLAVADFASRSLFFESFDKSWDSRWIYSDDSKYSGKFERTADGIKVWVWNMQSAVPPTNCILHMHRCRFSAAVPASRLMYVRMVTWSFFGCTVLCKN